MLENCDKFFENLEYFNNLYAKASKLINLIYKVRFYFTIKEILFSKQFLTDQVEVSSGVEFKPGSRGTFFGINFTVVDMQDDFAFVLEDKLSGN